MNNFSAKLRRLMNRIAIPNLMYYICFTQGLVYVADLLTQNQISSAIYFYRPLILQGQVWRVLTFLAEPINPHPIWIIFSIIFYISIWRTVEAAWGADKLTHYILLNWLLIVVCGFITGSAANYFMFMSLVMVWGTVAPRDRVNLYMVLPIEAKYLAIAYGIILIIFLIMGNFSVIPTIITYMVFFGKDHIRPLKNKIKFNKMFKG